MRVLIAGCGYVGLPLGAELARRGHEVFGLRRSGAADSALLAEGIRPLQGDITRPEDLAALPSRYDWVVNCTASSGGGPEAYHALYLEGTRNLIDWLRPNPPAKFVYTSSTSVYGQMDGSIVHEDTPSAPTAETSRILIATEQLLLQSCRQEHFPAVILRVAGIYGPHRGHYYKQFVRNEARISGREGRWLNMIHRDDVVGAVIAALENGTPGRIYNVSDDEPVTQLVFFRWLAGILQVPIPAFASEHSDAVRKRGLTNKRVSNQRLKNELGYQLRYPTFREGCQAELGTW
jgi:nucleoside-diphosphate-sugar epimerase